MARRIALVLIISLVLTLCPSCTPTVKSDVSYNYFDTVCTIYDYSGMNNRYFDNFCSQFWQKLEEYHKLFDIYHEYSGMTNLASVNRQAGAGAIKVDEKIIDLLLYSRELHAVTSGEVNIAMGAVTSLWREGAEKKLPPSEEALREASRHTDIKKLVIDKTAGTVELLDPEASLDVGAIAKGYAADKMAEFAREYGVKGPILIDLGGNLITVGVREGGYAVHVRNPDIASDKATAMTIDGFLGAVATSGDYQRYFVYGGVRYHHIIDKDTLMPSAYFGSVTVLTDSAALSDALSTALFSMPIDKGDALAAATDGVSRVIWIDKDGKITDKSYN